MISKLMSTVTSNLRAFWRQFRSGRSSDAPRPGQSARELRDGMGPLPGGMTEEMNPPAVYRYFERKFRSTD